MQVQSEFDLPTSTVVGSDPRNGLALCQLHPYRLPREEVFISQLRGT